MMLSVNDVYLSYNPSPHLLKTEQNDDVVKQAHVHVETGKTLAIVGESGSGKTTLARAIMGLLKPRLGSIIFQDEDIYHTTPLLKKYIQSQMQMVFQDPLGSLNPMMNVREILEEPLLTHRFWMKESERLKLITQALEKVGLSPSDMARYPHTFSGGQCQRIAIARAVILSPKILVCDEPVSALDVSVQAQILKLLMDLQQQLSMSLIFISHNLAVVKLIAHSVAVMYKGRILEYGDAHKIFSSPQHPYTKDLMAAVPIPAYPSPTITCTNVHEEQKMDTPTHGCPYWHRCRFVKAECKKRPPPLEDCATDHKCACIVANKLF